MRFLRVIIPLVITAALVWFLNTPVGSLPAIGILLDPVGGVWQSAEATDKDFNEDIELDGLKGEVRIWFDERMVPHIHATNDADLYYAQGYLHAYFRLWQMDMQTRAAAGRVSEVVGSRALRFDRMQRRKGMVYGAENSLQAMEADSRTKTAMDAYTAGVNDYIAALNFRQFPVEYKLMGFEPEAWTNLKTALLLKYMADDLTGYTEDIPLTYLRTVLPKEEMEFLFPERISGSTPVIPSGTIFQPATLPVPESPADSMWLMPESGDFTEVMQEEKGKGSNNWALSGSKTVSGATILCNDPHLGLNLPSLWYEVQLQAPGINVYGVSLPGAPGVIIGFNENISWGFTNNYRDVKDFYSIKPVTNDAMRYHFEGMQLGYDVREEVIKVNDSADYVDSVKYTIHGPVIYDNNFPAPGGYKYPLALTWMAHKGTNELLSIYLLNRAKDYMSFTEAVSEFKCPAQNIAYADKEGNIALWTQGQFINKWKGQGRYIMDGSDSATLWGDMIPIAANPYVLNPQQGFVSSANQITTDSTYPYWYNGYFHDFRAWRINEVLSQMQQAGIEDMFALQNDVHSTLAKRILPIMLGQIKYRDLNERQQQYFSGLSKWFFDLKAESQEATFFQIWWSALYNGIWQDEFEEVPEGLWPSPERTMQLLQNDTTLIYYDNRKTKDRESYREIINIAFNKTIDSIEKLKVAGNAEWYKAKNTSVMHLTKISAFSVEGIKTGGWGNTVNAMKKTHGPSWRMVVQMNKDIEAYGVYPGGQSGNPGSKYYLSFIKNWEQGKYYKLLFLPNNKQQNNERIKYTWNFKPDKN